MKNFKYKYYSLCYPIFNTHRKSVGLVVITLYLLFMLSAICGISDGKTSTYTIIVVSAIYMIYSTLMVSYDMIEVDMEMNKPKPKIKIKFKWKD